MTNIYDINTFDDGTYDFHDGFSFEDLTTRNLKKLNKQTRFNNPNHTKKNVKAQSAKNTYKNFKEFERTIKESAKRGEEYPVMSMEDYAFIKSNNKTSYRVNEDGTTNAYYNNGGLDRPIYVYNVCNIKLKNG